jgi:hypothetical protein
MVRPRSNYSNQSVPHNPPNNQYKHTSYPATHSTANSVKAKPKPELIHNPHISDEKLDFWIKNNLNVLLVGHAGTGKTSKIVSAFKRNGLNFKYFSASTMDPWVDFVGIPKEMQDENGESYLDLVRPKDFQQDNVQALIFDEYNRASSKVKNAVMELIQFKSINGRKLHNLRMVWAAINPDDGEYDVDPMDPAQKDRFHITIEVPYYPDIDYFASQYGTEVGQVAVEWWDGLPKEIRQKVSPRRLDYALDYFKHGGDMSEILDKKSNVQKLFTALKSVSVKSLLDNAYNTQNVNKAIEIVTDDNMFNSALVYIIQQPKYIDFFLSKAPTEKIASVIAEEELVLEYVVKNQKHPAFKEVVDDVLGANLNQELVKRITKAIS